MLGGLQMDYEFETLEALNEFLERLRDILTNAGCATCELRIKENGIPDCDKGAYFGETGCIRKHMWDKIEDTLSRIDMDVEDLLDYLAGYTKDYSNY